MNILVLDDDRRLVPLVRNTLEQAGHDTVAAKGPGELRHRMQRFRPDLVLIDHAVVTGPQSVGLRSMLPVGATVVLMGAADPQRPEIRKLQQQLGALSYLRKPFSVIDLAERLEQLLPRRRGTPGRLSEGIRGLTERMGTTREQVSDDRRNAALLARLWSDRATGRLTLEGDGRDRSVDLLRGGVSDGQAWMLVQQALEGDGQLRWEPRQMPGAGDWSGLGMAIYASVMSSDGGGFFRRSRYKALHTRVDPTALAALPLSSATRTLLELASPHLPLGRLAAERDLSVAEFADELHKLMLLELVELQPPVAPHRAAPPDRGPVDSQPKGGSAGPSSTGSFSSSSRSRGSTSSSSSRSSSRSRRSGDSSSSSRSRRSSSSNGRASKTVSRAERRARARRKAARRRAKARAARRRADSSDSSTISDVRRRRRSQGMERRLSAEVERLSDASPWVVLGVSKSSDRQAIKAAADRMRKRYGDLQKRKDLSEKVHSLAATLAEGIEAAADKIDRGVHLDEHSGPNLTDHQRMVATAREALEAGRWGVADKLLTRAREDSLSDPTILGLLGWARFNNSARPKADRQQDAKDLLLLSEQLDPKFTEGQLYLSRVLLKLGEAERALARVNRILKREELPEAREIKYRCRELLAPEQG